MLSSRIASILTMPLRGYRLFWSRPSKVSKHGDLMRLHAYLGDRQAQEKEEDGGYSTYLDNLRALVLSCAARGDSFTFLEGLVKTWRQELRLYRIKNPLSNTHFGEGR